MLNIKPANYKFCPFCATRLKLKKEAGDKRKYCPNCKWTYYPHVNSAAAAIIKRGDKVLMVKRARDPYKHTWMFPAGFINFGEHPEETLIREVKEETGLNAKNPKLLEIIQAIDDSRAMGHFVFFYEVEATGKLKMLDKKENEDISWFDIKNPPKIGWLLHHTIVR